MTAQLAFLFTDIEASTRAWERDDDMSAALARHEEVIQLAVRAAVIGVVVVAASWGLLIVLARRLPAGVLKDLAGFLPACVTTVRRLRRDPRVPRRAKVAMVLAGLWVLSPIDLIPEFVPLIGPLDDVVVVALALRYAARRVPRAAIEEAWAGDPRLLERLLGPAGGG